MVMITLFLLVRLVIATSLRYNKDNDYIQLITTPCYSLISPTVVAKSRTFQSFLAANIQVHIERVQVRLFTHK